MKYYIFKFGNGPVRVQIGLKAESPEDAARKVKEDLGRYRSSHNVDEAALARSMPNASPESLREAVTILARGDMADIGVDIQSRHFENIHVVAFPQDITTTDIVEAVELDTLPGLP